jgi:acyl carrier protein
MTGSISQDQMAVLWAQMLGVSHVGPDDNFFAVGGHSLLGVKLIAAVQEKLDPDIELTLSDLFEFPTLAAFTGHLESLAAPSEETGSI